MLLSWISKFCASVLGSILLVIVIAFTLNQTVLKPSYIESQLQHVNAYSELSDGIVTEIAKNNVDSGIPNDELVSKLKMVITPQVVQSKLNLTLTQIQAFYLRGGTVPVIDVSDLVTRAQAVGVPVQDPTLSKPIELTTLANTKKLADKLKAAQIAVLAAVVVLLGAMIAIAVKRKKYTPLAVLLITLGVSVCLVGGAVLLAKSQLNTHLKVDYNTNAFSGVAHDLANSMASDIARRFFITGGVSLLLGVAGFAALKYFAKPRSPLRAQRPAPTVPAVPVSQGYVDAIAAAPTQPAAPVRAVPTVPKLKRPVREKPPKPPQLIQ